MSLLYQLLSKSIQLLWPTQKAQGYLLDLGERKSWSEEERHISIVAFCDWAETIGISLSEGVQSPLLTIQEIRESIPKKRTTTRSADGVATDLQSIALLTPSSPKTLANNLSSWMQPNRLDHLWLLSLGRIVEGESALPGLLYHRRSYNAFSQTLSRAWGNLQSGQLDIADSLVLFSLISLWQRRRNTNEVRANRGIAKPRRITPKPLTNLSDSLILPGQFRELLHFARDNHLHSVALLAIEAAMTQAHLTPHLENASKKRITSLHTWLSTIDKELETLAFADLLEEDYSFFLYRLKMMQAYSTKQAFPKPPESIASHPYIQVSWILHKIYHKEMTPQDLAPWLLDEDWEGKAMLHSQLEKQKRALP